MPLVRQELAARWSGGALTWTWVLFQPLVQIAIYAVVFSALVVQRNGAGLEQRGYVLYLCLGVFPWVAISEGLARSTSVLKECAGLIKVHGISLPLISAKTVIASWVLGSIGFLLTLVFAVATGTKPSWLWLLVPVPVMSLLLSSVGIAWWIAPLSTLARDFQSFVSLFLPILFWSAPFVYVPDLLPHWAQRLQAWHPLAPGLSAIRGAVLHDRLPETMEMMRLVLYPCVLLASGLAISRRLESDVRDAL